MHPLVAQRVVGVAALLHHLVDQSLLSQSAPRRQDSSPLALGLLKPSSKAKIFAKNLAPFPLGACPAQVPRTEALSPQQPELPRES